MALVAPLQSSSDYLYCVDRPVASFTPQTHSMLTTTLMTPTDLGLAQSCTITASTHWMARYGAPGTSHSFVLNPSSTLAGLT